LSELENQIIKSAHYHASNPVNKKTSSEEKANRQYKLWYDLAFSHLTGTLVPQLKNANEKFVDYWLAYFFWGAQAEMKRGVFDEQAMRYEYGFYATGYLCLTDQTLYIVTLRKLTQTYPLFSDSFRGYMGGYMGGVVDKRAPLKEDKVRDTPYKLILAAQITEDKQANDILVIRTANVTWEISQHFTGTLQEMLTGIRMGISGQLTQIWNPAKASVAKQPSVDVTDLLKKLGELRDTGILTNVEFEQKKKELLARL